MQDLNLMQNQGDSIYCWLGMDGEGNQPGNQNFSITSLRPGSPLHSETNNLIMWGVGAANVTDIPFNFYANEGYGMMP